MPRRTLAFCFSWLLLLVGWSGYASASGLLVPNEDEELTSAPFTRVQTLSFDITVNDVEAVVVERRVYNVATGPVGYYRSLSGSAELESFVVNAEQRSVDVLDTDAANALRRELVEDVHAVAALREWNSRLLVADAIPVADSGGIEIEITTRVPLSSIGTLSGFSLPLDWDEGDINAVDIQIATQTSAPLHTLFSPTHDLNVVRDSATVASATYSGNGVNGSSDFTLLIATGSEPFRMDFVPFRRSDGEDGFFMGLLGAPKTEASGDSVPRDIVFVLDTSGSMGGTKIVEAKRALSGALSGLNASDRFAVVRFSDQVARFSDIALSADGDNIAAALGYVQELTAEGGTDIDAALTSGFELLPSDGERLRYTVLLTDGQPTNGVVDVDTIVANAVMRNEGRARIVPIGIGDDTNTVLMDRLAMAGNSDAIYIRPGTSVEGAISEFFAQIDSPALASPTIDLSAFGVSAQLPETLPDIFFGRTQVVVGRYSQAGSALLTLSGQTGEGTVSTQFELTLPDRYLDCPTVSRLWGQRQVGTLLEQIKLGDASDETREQAIRLATRHGVQTQFTTFRVNVYGDVEANYEEVSTEVVGAVATGTSAGLSGVSGGNVVATQTVDGLRLASDRTFLYQGGFFVDTTTAESEPGTALSFGGRAFFELIADQSELGAARLLSVANNVQVEIGGEIYKVTDEQVREFDANPEPAEPQQGANAAQGAPEAVSPTGVANPGAANSADTGGDDDADEGEATDAGTQKHNKANDGADVSRGLGCQFSRSTKHPALWTIGSLLLGLVVAIRRRRAASRLK